MSRKHHRSVSFSSKSSVACYSLPSSDGSASSRHDVSAVFDISIYYGTGHWDITGKATTRFLSSHPSIHNFLFPTFLAYPSNSILPATISRFETSECYREILGNGSGKFRNFPRDYPRSAERVRYAASRRDFFGVNLIKTQRVADRARRKIKGACARCSGGIKRYRFPIRDAPASTLHTFRRRNTGGDLYCVSKYRGLANKAVICRVGCSGGTARNCIPW